MILNVENLSHGFGDRAIFTDVSFRLLAGEHIGLVGANGEGKSTFMNIVTGKLMPDEGNVEWNKHVRVGYLDQHAVLKKGMTIADVLKSAFAYLFEMEEQITKIYESMADASEEEINDKMEEVGTLQDLLTNHDFYMIDAKVEQVARALGLLELGLDHDVTDLSGGQRTKVLLAKLLLEKPEILLLDEPTNYLDAEHIAWLKRYLQEYENAFILISHDIPFLNEVVNLIYHMENQQLNRYVGNYDKFLEVYEAKKQQQEAAYRKQQQEINELKDFVARNKARVATRNMAMSRQKKLDKMEVIELAKEKPKPEFHFKEARTPGKVLFETTDLIIGYDQSSPLSKPINLRMERGEKIAIVGTNGIGKSTLLKSLLGLVKPLDGKVMLGDYLQLGYFEQEMAGTENSCMEEIWQEFPGYSQYEVRSALAKCGLTTKHIESKVKVLSGGEQAKVRLCKLMNRESNLLILDEPTNHLDVDAKDELKRALQAYKGSVLLVCHEPQFYEDIVSQVWNLEEYSRLAI
ncbi:MAG: ABC-F family ATP-binding cassette domain-containing protein [Wujia sp.]